MAMKQVLLLALAATTCNGLAVQQRTEMKGPAAGASLLEMKAGESSAARQSRVESLVNAEQTALVTQEAALEQIAQQQAAMAKQQAELKIESEKVFEMVSDSLKKPEQKSSLIQVASSQSSGLKVVMDKLNRVKDAKVWKAQLISGVVYLVLVIIAGWIYGAYFTYEYPPLKYPAAPRVPGGGFSFGIFDGFRCDPDMRIFCCSSFCVPVRWADTASSPKVGFVKFWSGLFLFTTMYAFIGITYSASAVILIYLGIANRQKIRQAYGMDHSSASSYAQDCAVWTACCPCAAMQEAMEVEFVDPINPPEPMSMLSSMHTPGGAGKFVAGSGGPSATGNQGWLPTPSAPSAPRKQHGVCC
eukprot:TRINITY_DN1165_c5_g1_i1.p1 TRINITY_DN1165_c5_g1~~TRINITY_DN1165_c5_g1_i1.p1  ORF type:complete len:358 (+),score=91.20 TRINITY_DN1165_c5_g1_i1:87-1160(+)